MKKLTFEFVKAKFEENGWSLLCSEYVNNNVRMKCSCENGHIQYKTWNSFKHSITCQICSYKKNRKNFDYVKEYIKRTGEGLLSEQSCYKNNKSKLTFKCKIRGCIYKTTWNHFQQGSRCEKCSYIKRSNSKLGKNNSSWKGGVTASSLPLYDTYSYRLFGIDKVCIIYKDSLKLLGVGCYKCKKMFVPKVSSVKARIKSLEVAYSGQNNFYCSSKCKKECDVYGQIKYPKGFKKHVQSRWGQGIWADEVKLRANSICKNCNKTYDSMYAHHIIPYKVCKFVYLDPDNGICLCKICHNKAHEKEGCTLIALREESDEYV